MPHVAVDAGGTFTDVVVMEDDGQTATYKVLSDPDAPAEGMLAALDVATSDLRQVTTLVNGTTAGLNAVLTRSGARVLLLTTHGFRDVLAIGRAERVDVWRLKYERPRHLVGPDDVFEIRERVRVDGSVAHAWDAADLEAILAHIDATAIESVAVCFLHATRNAVHEIAVRDALLAARPSLRVSLSHQVAPEVGEYERFSSTVVDAYVAAVVGDYLGRTEQGVLERGLRVPLLIMRSSGGLTSARSARDQPIQTLVSGPSGGALGARVVARALGRRRLLAIDMGGTSLDASLIVDFEVATSTTFELGGLPVQMPVVDLVTVGAGGGSVAWLEHGALRVGPRSAGARPGPACYGLGGTEPTVTDANVVLNRLGSDGLTGTDLRLDASAARSAFEPLATGLGLSVEAAAEAVIAVTNAKMADALRELTVRRGHDPREFAILAFGGAGPLHAAALADEMDVSEIIVPSASGVFSAWGMLHAPIRHDLARSLLVPTESPGARSLRAVHEQLREAAGRLVAADALDPGLADYLASVDMRYEGQQFTVTVHGDIEDPPARWDARFRTDYRVMYGEVAGQPGTELVTARITARGPSRRPVAPTSIEGSTRPASRSAVFVGGRLHECPVLDRRAVDRPVAGPAILVDGGAPIFVPPGWTARTGGLDAIELQRDAA